MTRNAKTLLLGLMGIAVCAAPGAGRQPDKPAKPADTPAELQAEIAALRAPKVAWRGIAWKSCLIEGLNETRAQNKPSLVWVFIDRPADDARC